MHIFDEIKSRMKEMMDQDGRFSETYRKIVMDKLTSIIDDIMHRDKK